MGGILRHSGVDGFLGNARAVFEEANQLDIEWEAFLLTIHGMFRDGLFTTADLMDRLGGVGIDIEYKGPQGSMPSDLLADARSLGNAFGKRTDSRYGKSGVHIRKVGTVQGAARWQVALGGDAQDDTAIVPTPGRL